MAARISTANGHQEEQSQGMFYGDQANEETGSDGESVSTRSLLQKFRSNEVACGVKYTEPG